MLSCDLGAGAGAGSSLCASDKCAVCRIARHGFSAKKEGKAGVGVFTTSTSGRVFESIEAYDDDPATRKVLLVCRVIAGRVHKPLDNLKEFVGQTGFNSLAGKVGPYSAGCGALHAGLAPPRRPPLPSHATPSLARWSREHSKRDGGENVATMEKIVAHEVEI